MCVNEDCRRYFQDIQKAEALAQSPGEKRIGSAAHDPIVVESETEEDKDMFTMKVYEMQTEASVDDALAALMELNILKVPGTVVDNGDALDAPRRSSRKRKPRFPIGKLLGEDTVKIALRHNIAALRLFLYQNDLPINQKLCLMFNAPAAASGTTDMVGPSEEEGSKTSTGQFVEPRFLELDLDVKDMTLQEVYDQMTQGDDPEMERLGDPGTSLMLLRQAEKDGVGGFSEPELMDALLQSSNALADGNDSKNGSKKKPASERGFTGTLLSRGLPGDNPVAGKKKSLDETEETTDDNTAAAAEVEGNSRPRKKPKVIASPSKCVSPGLRKVSPAGDTMATTASNNSAELNCSGDISGNVHMVVENVKNSGVIPIGPDNEATCLEAARWAIKQARSSAALDELTSACIQKLFEMQ
jgi:hypothetical protein